MKSEKEKMIAGENYFSNDKELTADRQKAKKLLFELNTNNYVVSKKSKSILQQLLPNASANIYIEPPFHCDYGYNIRLGKRVYFNVNCVILDSNIVTIGDNAFIGPDVHIYTATHPINAIERLKIEFSKPVIIGNDCWIGGKTVICPGVTIGNGCVIGANSVVTKDVPDNSLALGNPARVTKKLI